jgi:hypothetical protein
MFAAGEANDPAAFRTALKVWERVGLGALKRLDRLHKRYLSAMRSLAQVRKLLKAKVAQINIGEKQQINTGTTALKAPKPTIPNG